MKSLLKLLLAVIIIAVLVVVGAFVYFKVAYDINLITTFKQIKAVTVPTNLENVLPNAYTQNDLSTMQTKINNSIPDFIAYSQQDGYSVNSGIPESTLMSENINLTDKECAGLLNVVMTNSSTNVSLKIENTTLNFELVQVTFSNLSETSVDFNTVVKIDISPLKNTYKEEWFSFLINKLPNNMYISSTITIEKLPTQFSYTKTSKSFTINNLNSSDTIGLLTVINKFVKTYEVQDLTLLISGGFADALITGTEETPGISKSLTVLGATDFEFKSIENTINFIIKK